MTLRDQAGERAGYDPAGHDPAGQAAPPGRYDRAAEAGELGARGPEDGGDRSPGRDEPGDDAPPWFIGRPGAS